MSELERLVETDDPVQRRVCALTAHHFTEWLINSHGANRKSDVTIESNLIEQFQWHRLQGRLDRGGLLQFIATWLGLRQSPLELKHPVNLWGYSTEEALTEQFERYMAGSATEDDKETVRRALLSLKLHKSTVENVLNHLREF